MISYNRTTCGVFEKSRSDLGHIKNIQIEVRFQEKPLKSSDLGGFLMVLSTFSALLIVGKRPRS